MFEDVGSVLDSHSPVIAPQYQKTFKRHVREIPRLDNRPENGTLDSSEHNYRIYHTDRGGRYEQVESGAMWHIRFHFFPVVVFPGQPRVQRE